MKMSLKNVMLINAISSGATGMLLVFFSGFTAQIFEVPESNSFVAVGIFLFVFSLFALFTGLQKPIQKVMVKLTIVLDSLWVLGSLTILVFQLFSMSALGYFLIAGVAVWVALMAYLQLKGLGKEYSITA